MRHRLILTLFAASFCGALPAHADDCGTLMSAMIAQTGIPYAATVTIQGPGAPQETSKSIYTNNTFYTQVNGQWQSMAMSGKEAADMVRDQAKTAKQTCHVQGGDSVNGQPATLYVAHVENQGTVSDNKVWLAGSKLLKTEVQIQGGPHIVTLYDYSNVRAPAGATPMGPPPQQQQQQQQ